MKTRISAIFAACCLSLVIAAPVLTDDPPATSDSEIRKLMIRESLGSYSGNCPCPYNTDRAGRRCGAALLRPRYIGRAGGAIPGSPGYPGTKIRERLSCRTIASTSKHRITAITRFTVRIPVIICPPITTGMISALTLAVNLL